MKYAIFASGIALAATFAPLSAQAQQQVAIAATTVQMHAGPDARYPVVAIVPTNSAVNVIGCLRDYTWCDIHVGGYRGWAYAPHLRMAYQNSYAPLSSIGGALGIAALSFILNDYWSDNYRDRQWYDQRSHWGRSIYTPHYSYARPPAVVIEQHEPMYAPRYGYGASPAPGLQRNR